MPNGVPFYFSYLYENKHTMIITQTLRLPTLEIVKGNTYFETYTITDDDDNPVDLSGYDLIKMDIRTGLTANTKLLHSSSLENGEITVSGDFNEIITFKIDPAITKEWNAGTYHRDVFFVDDVAEMSTTLLKGKIIVINNITSI